MIVNKMHTAPTTSRMLFFILFFMFVAHRSAKNEVKHFPSAKPNIANDAFWLDSAFLSFVFSGLCSTKLFAAINDNVEK